MKFINLNIYLILCLLLSGCTKLVQVEPPINSIVDATVFSDDKTATSTVNGLYSMLLLNITDFSSYPLSLYPALYADELSPGVSGTGSDVFFNNSIPSNNSFVAALWSRGYSNIYLANSCLDGLRTATELTESTRKRLLGETLTLRAFFYFYLVNLYGDVPLILNTDYRANQSMARTSTDSIFAAISRDLVDARLLLSVDYPTAGKYRINKWAATSLLSRVLLYMRKWPEAEAMATEVISSGMYALADLNKVFLTGSTEAIWQINPTGLPFNTYEGNSLIPASSTVLPAFTLSKNLLDCFDLNDNRKNQWMGNNTVGLQQYTFPAKYKVKTGLGSAATECPVYFRLGEQYLIRAEARSELNKLDSATKDLNAIRNRAGLVSITPVSREESLQSIMLERRKELFTEWGHRWFDLKRTGQAGAVLKPQKPNWQSTDALFPLPFKEISLNPLLVQNDGYE